MKQIHIFTLFATAHTFFDKQFKYLSDHGCQIILISTFHPDAEQFAHRNNIQYYPTYIPRKINIVAIFKCIKRLCTIIKKEKPDMVIGHTPVGALVAMFSSWICHIRYRVYYRHGLIYTTMNGIKRIILKNEERVVSYLATHIINVSPSLSDVAKRDNLNSSKKQYIFGHGTCGGIDAQRHFNPSIIDYSKLSTIRASLQITKDNLVFGFCGRICKDKGIAELVQGFKLFSERHANYHAKLLLVGTYDTRTPLPNSLKNTINNNPDIIRTGHIDKEIIPYYYALMDVFVFPSYREGFGMSVLEASAMEKPILVSKSHGCIDSIIEHETGEYISISPEDICSGMIQMTDTAKRRILGKNGRAMVLKQYDWAVLWPIIYSFYQQFFKQCTQNISNAY